MAAQKKIKWGTFLFLCYCAFAAFASNRVHVHERQMALLSCAWRIGVSLQNYSKDHTGMTPTSLHDLVSLGDDPLLNQFDLLLPTTELKKLPPATVVVKSHPEHGKVAVVHADFSNGFESP